MNKVSQQIIDFMVRHHLNQAEMAKRLEVSQPTLCNWLEGTHGITKKNIARIKFICGDWTDFSDLRPPQPRQEPEDHLLAYLLDAWEELDGNQRGRLIGFVETLKSEKNRAKNPAVQGVRGA